MKNKEVTPTPVDGADMYLKLVFSRCARDEVFTMDQQQFENVFKGGLKRHRDRIEEFCLRHALNFSVNRGKKTYCFSLIEGD
jgi:hypothetical protein